MNEEFLSGLGIDKQTSELILEKYESERLNERISSELVSAGAVDKAAAELMLDKDGLNAENLSERIGELKEQHPMLFKTAAPRIVTSAEGKTSVDKDSFVKMGYRERLELFKKSPDTYKRLVE